MKKYLFTILFSSQLLACPQGYDLTSPVHIPVGVEVGGVTEEVFMKISTELENLYSADVSSRGGKLVVTKAWASTEVNAYAQREKEEWKVILLGGIGRHKFMTEDGFALIVCHEIGHHLGGVPRSDGIDIGWATNEGQSDYYSTMKCLRRYWKNADNARIISSLNIPETLRTKCENEALCIRSGMAGLSAANVFADLAWFGKKPKFETPDTKIVKQIYSSHPKAQCRLDTYFQGSLCEASYNDEMTSETEGACHESLGHKQGMRPLCWFKPTL